MLVEEAASGGRPPFKVQLPLRVKTLHGVQLRPLPGAFKVGEHCFAPFHPTLSVLPGPEGSGLDLQLKAIYNSSSWRYKANEREDLWDGEGTLIQRKALVDINSMYFSPLGFGWRLHMGRLFRLFRDTSSCTSVRYVYEDPSGATHEFGPYCDDNSDLGQSPNGVFWAVDGSHLLLQVQGFDSSR